MGSGAFERKFGFSVDAGWVLPCVGFGSFLFVADTVNVPVLLVKESIASYESWLLSVLLIAAMVWWASKKNWERCWSLAAVIVFTLCVILYYAISLLFPALMQQPVIAILVETASLVGRAGLSFLWMVVILPMGSRRVAFILTFSMCVFALFCLIIILFKENAARILLLLLPPLSACCLQVFHRKRDSSFGFADPCKDEIFVQAQAFLDTRSNKFVFGAGIIIPLVCGSLVLTYACSLWPHAVMDQAQLLSAQMGIFAAAMVLAAIQVALVAFFWASANFMFISAAIPLLLLDMLLVSGLDWFIVYFVLTLVAKCLILLCVYATYVFRIGRSWMNPWCAGFLAFSFGGLLGACAVRFLPLENPRVFVLAIVTIYVLSVCVALLRFGMTITQAFEGHLTGGFRGEYRYRTAIDGLAETYGLTTRERDILAELGRGRNPAYIAERLVISPQTAKTHQKNIYAKMDVHSQQDLIMLVDRAIEKPSPK